MSETKEPGRPKKISDEKLKEIALSIKHKNGRKKLLFNFFKMKRVLEDKRGNAELRTILMN